MALQASSRLLSTAIAAIYSVMMLWEHAAIERIISRMETVELDWTGISRVMRCAAAAIIAVESFCLHESCTIRRVNFKSGQRVDEMQRSNCCGLMVLIISSVPKFWRQESKPFSASSAKDSPTLARRAHQLQHHPTSFVFQSQSNVH
jgi:hypothetical protein